MAKLTPFWLRSLLMSLVSAALGALLAHFFLMPHIVGWTTGLPAPGLMARLGATEGVEAESGAQRSNYETLTVFHNALGLIREHYLTEVEPDWVMDGAIRGIFRALDDDSAYLTAGQTEIFHERAGLLGDVGVTLDKRYYLHVDSVLPGSPAEAAGIEEGAAVTEIAGITTREMQIPVGRLLLAGAPGSEVSLMVRDSADAEAEDIRLIRRELAPPPVEHRVLEPGIGWMRIRSFHAGTTDQVVAAIAALENEGVDALVLDLRGSRGDEDYALDLRAVGGLFLGDALVAQLGGRQDAEEAPALLAGIPNATSWNGALTVLANGTTAGPGELLAAAIVADGRGAFVGGRTAGRTGAPELIELPEGDALLLTVRQYLDPEGEELLGVGAVPSITPADLERDVDTLDDEDPELDFALFQIRQERADRKEAA